MPYKPKIAMEIWDMAPEEWPAAALEPFKDVVSDPAAWAKKCVSEYGAELIVLQLKSTDPNGTDASPEDASATVKKVLSAIDVPLVVWGVANPAKDEAVFKKIAEDCQDVQLTLGPVEDKNHKGIGAACMGYGHAIISSSPIDVNLAKQVNILLENLGMPWIAWSSTPPPVVWVMVWSTLTRLWNVSEWPPWPRVTTSCRCP
ncbi:hypothetical protein [Desulfosarcina cetonica]|uniref:hypothetical protein n=1 Tax=Desulfosarcina cetonica TaxID=90730 RepID=UPI000AB1E641|nr:hypothetical protein [Desulfosarcina cetonica]